MRLEEREEEPSSPDLPSCDAVTFAGPGTGSAHTRLSNDWAAHCEIQTLQFQSSFGRSSFRVQKIYIFFTHLVFKVSEKGNLLIKWVRRKTGQPETNLRGSSALSQSVFQERSPRLWKGNLVAAVLGVAAVF